MTEEELARFDGRDGRQAFVAVNGKVYDFTDSPLWRHGDHEGRHQAGCDLSEALRSAPHVRAVIERYPVVAPLETEAVGAAASRRLPWIAVAAAIILLLAALLFIL